LVSIEEVPHMCLSGQSVCVLGCHIATTFYFDVRKSENKLRTVMKVQYA
jgi:hypothetical protein